MTQDSDSFDLEQFRSPTELPPAAKKRRLPRFCKGEFLRGPIPWSWLVQATRLPGKALAVGLVLWREAGIEKVRTVVLSPIRLREAGILADAARRGVRVLERAGLVEIKRLPGRCLEVTIRDFSRTDDHSAGGDDSPRPR